MPDNVTANAGTGGAVFASDDIGGVQYPRTKIVIGADGVNGGDVSSTNPLPTTAGNGTLTDGSGTITTGGVAQQIFASNSAREYFFIQNNGGQALWINFGTTAVQNQPSIRIDPGSSYESPSHFVSNESVSVIGPTTGQTFTAKQA